MSTATLSSKGQITLPSGIRRAMGIDTGDRVEFVQVAPRRYEMIAATLPVTALKGLVIAPASGAVSVEAMNEAVRRRVAQANEP